MLREEVLRGWDNCKTKLAAVRLTPKEKEIWKFMNRSKIGSFSSFAPGIDLEQLEKTISRERGLELDEKGESEMLTDYWLCWFNFGGLILDWINLKQFNKGLKEEMNRLEQHLYTLNNSTIDIFELVEIKVSPPDYYRNPLYCSEMKPMRGGIEVFNIAQPRSICRVDLEYKVLRVLPLQVISKTEISNVYQSNELRREERDQVPICSILPDWFGPTIEEVD